ncbi:hypothetical protein EZV62_018409 [Acer yangbiense]|uniref:Uncharacterized protein n=1 Tax=Acer yangbiense TaxID=1000413 RepID=A0A5C7HLG2_9ROSI|nr:hypothetical protein EZV62_018409 [Acer yangbiense]
MSIIMFDTNSTDTQFGHFDHHSIQITTIKLNGDNFYHWSLSVHMYIHGHGKINYLIGAKKEPKSIDAQHATWDAKNSMVMAWLVNSMEEDISSNYLDNSTAKEIWDSLTEMYSDLGNQSQIYELQLKLGESKQGSDTVTKYFAGLKRLWQDLDMYNEYTWKDLVDGAHYQKVVDNNKVTSGKGDRQREVERNKTRDGASTPSKWYI